MDRRFVLWLFSVSSCVLVCSVAAMSVRKVEESAERALRASLLLQGPANTAVRHLGAGSEYLPQLLRAALRDGRPDQVIDLLESSDATATYPVHAAAALFELGAEKESEAIWQGEGESGFERRLRAVRELRSRGLGGLVRDRRGRLLGGFSADGSFETVAAVPPQVVPRALLDELRAERPFAGRRLSIDLELSRLALDALSGVRGSVVLVDPVTGDVLAAVSDPRSWAGGGTPALEERREPASIAKLLAASAALRAGIDPDAAIAAMRCRGAIRLNGRLLYCSSVDGRLTGLDHALAISCNVAFAQLGLQVGDENLREEYRRFGFTVGDDVPHPYFGRVHRSRHDERSLGDLAIGLDEADITPLHAALLAAAMARGDLPAPRLIHAGDSALGLSPRPRLAGSRLSVAPRSGLLSPSWRPGLHRAMAAVAVSGGTAAHVAPPEFPVIMKTGTGRDPGHDFHVNYIGAGPVPEPKIAFAVRVTDGRTSRRVRRAAYRVTGQLLASLAAAERGSWHRPVQLTEDRGTSPREESIGSRRSGATFSGGAAVGQ